MTKINITYDTFFQNLTAIYSIYMVCQHSDYNFLGKIEQPRRRGITNHCTT